jgi:hypothetical protein
MDFTIPVIGAEEMFVYGKTNKHVNSFEELDLEYSIHPEAKAMVEELHDVPPLIWSSFKAERQYRQKFPQKYLMECFNRLRDFINSVRTNYRDSNHSDRLFMIRAGSYTEFPFCLEEH